MVPHVDIPIQYLKCLLLNNICTLLQNTHYINVNENVYDNFLNVANICSVIKASFLYFIQAKL